MARKRRVFTAACKGKVALAAVRGETLCWGHRVYPGTVVPVRDTHR